MRLLGADDAELELVRGDALGDVLRRADLERDLDLGVEAQEADQQARHEARARPGRGADREAAAQHVGLLLGGAHHVALEREDALCARDHGAALGRRLRLAPAAVDQRDAEALLERAHGLRDGRLRDAERLGGLGERAALDDGAERGELTRVHCCSGRGRRRRAARCRRAAGWRSWRARARARRPRRPRWPCARPRRARRSSHSGEIGERRARMSFSWCVRSTSSVSSKRPSCSFSPGRMPVITTGMSRSGSRPERRIMSFARSMMRTGSPMSSTKTSPPLADAAGLHDQLRGLVDRHEVARHLGARDGHRPAARDLLAEDRHDRAGRAEHVAEAHRDERRLALDLPERLDDPLGERLARAHRGLRVDGLVGRDEHEAVGAVARREPRDRARRERVVAQRLHRVLLHQRHVLVGGRVEHDGGPLQLEDRLHAGARRARRRSRGRSRSASTRAARDRSGRGCSRRGRRARAGRPPCARAGGRARSRSSRPRRSRAPCGRARRRRRRRGRATRARGRGCPRPGRRAAGRRGRRRR